MNIKVIALVLYTTCILAETTAMDKEQNDKQDKKSFTHLTDNLVNIGENHYDVKKDHILQKILLNTEKLESVNKRYIT